MIQSEAPRTPAELKKAADEALDKITKTYGIGAIQRLGVRKVGEPVPSIPSGLYGLDENILGIGGFPKGRVIEIFGPESSGKTTVLLNLIGQAQKAGGQCAIIDAEHALDPTWAHKNGVNVDELLVSQPDYGEQGLEIAEYLIETRAFSVIGIDSVAALVPRAELEGDMGDSHMGLQARLMSQALRKLTGAVAKSGTILVFINQVRDKIGVMFGNPETTTGGRALKFYASVRLDVRRIGLVKDGEEIIGSKVKIKAAKNKMSAPFREGEFDLLYDSGLDAVGSLADAAIEAGLIEKSGSWFSYKGQKAQGRNGLKALLDNDEAKAELKESLKKIE